MAEKNITINQLAKMIKKSFNSVDKKLECVATKDQADSLETRLSTMETKLSTVEKDVKYIKENLDDVANLGKRVDYVENILNIPVDKKN